MTADHPHGHGHHEHHHDEPMGPEEAVRSLLLLGQAALDEGDHAAAAEAYASALKIEQVRGASTFLIEIMPVMFIPAAVGLLDSWEALQGMLVPFIVITVSTTVFVMVVTGRVTQRVIRMEEGEKK